ncbi:unnamed protein product [Aureobasidium pullulans]|nr:unnamed protein product [Aureobasidium pullulans]
MRHQVSSDLAHKKLLIIPQLDQDPIHVLCPAPHRGCKTSRDRSTKRIMLGHSLNRTISPRNLLCSRITESLVSLNLNLNLAQPLKRPSMRCHHLNHSLDLSSRRLVLKHSQDRSSVRRRRFELRKWS